MVSAQSATWSISMRAGAGASVDGALTGGEPLEGGLLQDGGPAAEVDDLVDLGAVGGDGGDEGVAVDHPPRVGDGDGALPGDLAHLAGGDLAAVEGGEVDPDDHLGERPVLDHLTGRHVRCTVSSGTASGTVCARGAAGAVGASGAGGLGGGAVEDPAERVGGVGVARLAIA